MLRSLRCRIQPHLVSVIILFALGSLTYLPGYAPILYSDDWQLFGSLNLFGHLKLVDWNDRRPLVYTGFKLLLDLFGLNLRALYLANILVIILCAVMVYLIARRLLPRFELLALPVAILFLVYPVDQTRMWLTQNYTWIIALGTLLAVHWLLDFAEKGTAWKLIAALALIILPLGAYEAQLGVAVAASVLIAALSHSISLRRRLFLLLPVAAGGLFVLWRVVIQPAIFNVRDPYMQFQVSPAFVIELLRRMLMAFPVFQFSWVHPFSYLLGVSDLRLLFYLFGIIVTCGLLAWWTSREEGSTPEPAAPSRLTLEEKSSGMLYLLKIFILGLTLMLAGYVPAVVKFVPSLEAEATRINLFAIFGGALALGSALGFLALFAAQRYAQFRLILIAALIPLVMSGICQQMWNQNEARKAWAEQKHLWQALFKTLPNLKDGATVVVVMPYEPRPRPFQRLPVSNEWEVTSGLQVLYNNQTLIGMPYIPDHNDRFGMADLQPDGIHSLNGFTVSYQNVIFVYYRPGSYEVRLIRAPGDEIPLPFQPQGYAPDQNIPGGTPPSTVYRYLVQ